MDIPEIHFSDYDEVLREFYVKPGLVYFYFFDDDSDPSNLLEMLSSSMESYERFYRLKPSKHNFLIKDHPKLAPPCIFAIIFGIGGWIYHTARSKEELNNLLIELRKGYESAKRTKWRPEFWDKKIEF